MSNMAVASGSAAAPVLETYTWDFPKKQLKLIHDAGNVFARVINKETQVETPVPIPNASPILFRILIDHTVPLIEHESTTSFSPFTVTLESPKWRSAHGKLTLVERKGEQVWRYVRENITHIIPFDHVEIFNDGLKEYHVNCFGTKDRDWKLFLDPLSEAHVPLFFFQPTKDPLPYFRSAQMEKIEIVAGKTFALYMKRPTARSQWDSTKVIDSDWPAVTIIDSGQSDVKKLSSWGGHGAVMVEIVDEDYRMDKAHFVNDGGQGKVIYKPNIPFTRCAGQTKTFLCKREDVEVMIRQIKGRSQAAYVRSGRAAPAPLERKENEAAQEDLMSLNPDPQLSVYEGEIVRTADNCITWAVKTVRPLGIVLKEERGVIPFIKTPKDFMTSFPPRDITAGRSGKYQLALACKKNEPSKTLQLLEELLKEKEEGQILYDLAMLSLESHKGIKKEPAKAEQYLKRALPHSHVQSHYELGNHYFTARGAVVDAECLQLYQFVVDAITGNRPEALGLGAEGPKLAGAALYRIAYYYRNLKEHAQEVERLERAAALGHQKARDDLQIINSTNKYNLPPRRAAS